MDLASIVVIRPVEGSWIGDLTGRIDAGLSYTRGSQVAQSSANAVLTSRRPAFESTLAFDAVLTTVEGQPDSSGTSALQLLSLLDRAGVCWRSG